MPTTYPCLWFDDQGEEAARFYTSIFPNSRIVGVNHYPSGGVITVRFELDGQPFVALNGGPMFTFNEALSLTIPCADQAEIDYYWAKLTDGGEERPCGWLKDRYGVFWQVVPAHLEEVLGDDDPAGRDAAFELMMGMGKLDIAALEAAANR